MVEVRERKTVSYYHRTHQKKTQKRGNLVVGLQQQLTVDGGKGVALPPKVEGVGLPPHMDSLRHHSPEPSLFSVYHGDAVVINGMPSFIEVLADRRG